MKLEICVNSYQSAINAQNAGANSIELCSELSVGGVTPSYSLLKRVSENITIPVNVLIRPRSGDFYYSNSEFEQIKEDIKICKKLGFTGIVSGILNADNTIDIARTRELIRVSKPFSFTFHRAFDCVQNPIKALEILIDLGVDKILTSGLQEKAENGIELLKELHQLANSRLIILAGSGISFKNAHLFKEAGLTEIHSSASKVIATSNVFFDKTRQTISDIEAIQKILKVIRDK